MAPNTFYTSLNQARQTHCQAHLRVWHATTKEKFNNVPQKKLPKQSGQFLSGKSPYYFSRTTVSATAVAPKATDTVCCASLKDVSVGRYDSEYVPAGISLKRKLPFVVSV
jgi:hypothetical protein